MIVVGIFLNSRNCLIFTIIQFLMQFGICAIAVNKISTRTPREGDIGIIFDINVVNTANKENELLEYQIRSDKECCIKLTEDTTITNAGKIVGGSFGLLEPGEMKIVSVIWPTTEVFNRVGHCDIKITSTNSVKNEEKSLDQELRFDTRFDQIDPDGLTFKKRPEYHECPNWDMQFLNNCTPVHCEEKYFGKRNFYNTTTQMCEPASKCDGEKKIYDIYTNECLNYDNLLDPDEIEKIKKGDYKNNSFENSNLPVRVSQDAFKRDYNYYRYGSLLDVPRPREKGLPEIFCIFALAISTVIVYSSVCFCILLCVNWVTDSKVGIK